MFTVYPRRYGTLRAVLIDFVKFVIRQWKSFQRMPSNAAKVKLISAEEVHGMSLV